MNKIKIETLTKFFDRLPKECYYKSHPGVKVPYEKVDCSRFNIKDYLEESKNGEKEGSGYYTRAYTDNGWVFYTRIKNPNTIVFGSTYINHSIAEFKFNKLKVIFEDN